MNKTSILIGALVALAFAHTAVGYGSQDCTPENVHLWAFAGAVAVVDNTGTLYSLTGTSNPDPTGTTQPTLGNEPLGPATNEFFLGVTDVEDTNVVGDCNHDGTPGDYDGDLDVGTGGFAFGSGTTWEALCGYGHNVHAQSGAVADLTGLDFFVQIGIDDATGPTPPVFDPATGSEVQGCQTDGVISANPDGQLTAGGDCLNEYSSVNGGVNYASVCGGGIGGDDLYWGFIHCHVVPYPEPDVRCDPPGTTTTSF